MQPKIKIPFIVAPLLFILGWGLFISNYIRNEHTISVSEIITPIMLVVFIIFAVILLQKTHPVISDNTTVSIFFFLLTFFPISSQQLIVQLLVVFIFLLFIFISSHYTNSLIFLANSGLLTGIIFLFQKELGLFLLIYNVLFVYFIFPAGKKTKPFLLFLLTFFEIVLAYYMLNYVWEVKIIPIELTRVVQISNFINIIIVILFLVSIPLSTYNFLKLKVNRRNHISFANVANLFILVFYFITRLPVFILFFFIQLSLIVYFQDKKFKELNTAFKMIGIIYSLAYIFVQIENMLNL